MAQKKKRLSISEQLKELRDMREASKRRQAGERVTSDQVTSARKRAEAEAKSNARKQSVGGGMGKPKPKPQPTAAKPKPKPQPTAAKPKPKPKPTAAKTESKPKPNQTKGPRPRRAGTPSSPAPSPLKILKQAVTSVDKALKLTHKKGDTKKIGGVTYRWNGKKWVNLGRDF